ncbi:hypothetical protein ABIA38_007063 [Embleya sp. AB8]
MAGRGDDAKGVGSHGSLDGTAGSTTGSTTGGAPRRTRCGTGLGAGRGTRRGSDSRRGCVAASAAHPSGTGGKPVIGRRLPAVREHGNGSVRAHRHGDRRGRCPRRRRRLRRIGAREGRVLIMAGFVMPPAVGGAVVRRFGSDPEQLPGAVLRSTVPAGARPDGAVVGHELLETTTKIVSWPGGDAGSGGESASDRGAGAASDTSGSRPDGAGEPCSTADPASGSAPDTGGARMGGDAGSGTAFASARRPGEGSGAEARQFARLGSGPSLPRRRLGTRRGRGADRPAGARVRQRHPAREDEHA